MKNNTNTVRLLAFLSLLLATCLRAGPAGDILAPAQAGSVQIRGWIGNKLDLCLSQRVMSQDINRLVKPFRERTEKDGGGWRCEYWGKWFTSAALGYAYQPTAENRAKLDEAVRALIETQTPDGYIGTYDADHHLGIWDVWGRKYVLLGLIADYDLTGNKAALDAARRELDHLIGEAPADKVNLAETGIDVLKGLAPSSILEPIVLLYQRTGEKRYLDFAESIVARWDVPNKFTPRGLRLIDDALAGVPPRKIGAPKAYEMMSCFEGLCELYRVTGERKYLDAVVSFARSIRKNELMITGSASNQELWADGTRVQTGILEQPMETCVTVTWMKLCSQLLRLTGDPVWADELEVSLYNALLGAMTPQGDWWAYWCPLVGQRVPSPHQHSDVELSCCVANGPRGLLLTPRWALMTARDGPVVNLYAPGTSTAKLADGTEVKIVQETGYPVTDQAAFTVTPSRKGRFVLRLRIPAWSTSTALTVNGDPAPCQPGTYAKLDREWSPGDKVVLNLDLRGRAVRAPSGAPEFAVMRGPIVLALDSRLTAPQNIAVRLQVDDSGHVDLKPCAAKPDDVWMAFEVPFEVRPSHFFNHRQITLAMCDFVSAGNAWSETNLFRVWLPQPLFLGDMFPADTWKLMYPEAQKRPEIPTPSGGAEAVRTLPSESEAAPAPERADTGRYLVGAWMCPLWKPGCRNGKEWDQIKPFPDRQPLLGWYNEGDPGVTDWEIKWALDHGISFFVPCWYREKGNLGKPVRPWLGHWLHEGLFNSRYGDQLRFALLWENGNQRACGVASEKDLLENVVPFWLENYFHRKNYLVLDGKPVLFIYRPEILIKELGGVGPARTAIGKMRDLCIREGFKGLTVIGEYHESPSASLKELKDIGMDFVSSYHWPTFAGRLPSPATPEGLIRAQQMCWKEQEKNASLPGILTVSMGWDSRPWDPKFPESSCWRLDPQDFQKLCMDARAEMDKRPASSLEGRMLLVDNWNEFGEGHYVMPTRQFGFGYLDAIRNVFSTSPKPHSDTAPELR